MPVHHVLDINAHTEDLPDGPRLVTRWTWPSDLLKEEDMEALSEIFTRALRTIAEHAERPDAGGYTPSDLPWSRSARPRSTDCRTSGVDASDRVPTGGRTTADAVAGGHALPRAIRLPRRRRLHRTVRIRPRRSRRRHRAARRHRRPAAAAPNLRVGFLHEDLDEPVQAVAAEVPVPLEELDLTGADGAGAADERLTAFLAADRTRRFDLTTRR
ncbi:hypothetical protein NKH18_05385 [Streptomyces sp. M10(2022)]